MIATPAGPLAAALDQLAQEAGIGLICPPTEVGRYRVGAVHGRMSVPQALDRLLKGTGLAWRRGSGYSILVDRAAPASAAPAPPAPPAPIPEILVVGHKSQNFDIPRTPDDIQPYDVYSGDRILSSGADSPNTAFRTELVANAEFQSPSQQPSGQNASPRSEIDFNGLGPEQTLVLVDGARMPGIPNGNSLLQPDLNGIPLTAIDRIETLTSTSAGIYGSGALGGVVNVVLKHDYRGADLSVTTGISDRGDARQLRMEGRLGFTPDHGRTDVSVTFAYTRNSSLDYGDRRFTEAALRRTATNDLPELLGGENVINGVLVASGTPLTFKPQFGGGALSASFTYLPIGFSGSSADLNAALAAHAGTLPAELQAPDASGRRFSLLTTPSVGSVLVNVRHRFGDSVQAYVDLLRLGDDGRALIPTTPTEIVLLPNSPGNPFQQLIRVTFPQPGAGSTLTNSIVTTRLSAGLIVDLPRDWRVVANVSIGGIDEHEHITGSVLSQTLTIATLTGSSAAPMPLGDWSTFLAELSGYRLPASTEDALHSRFRDETLKLAAPLLRLPGGPLTLSLLVENRNDLTPSSPLLQDNLIGMGTTQQPSSRLSDHSTSLYSELRAPLIAKEDASPLRGLELQLATRLDHERESTTSDDAVYFVSRTPYRTVAAVTAGLRVFPLPRLMIRASVATGSAMPDVSQLVGFSQTIAGTFFGGLDPERGGRPVGSEAPYVLLYGGSSSVRPERARSLSVGLVYGRSGGPGPRLSVDFTRVDEWNVVSDFHDLDIPYFLANASRYPNRIQRAPLTPQDAAQGFTGGVITQIDTTSLNIGATVAETLAMRLDESLDLGRAGTLTITGGANWQPSLRYLLAPGQSWYQTAGYQESPLRWRASGGIAWRRGRSTVAVNAQYYGGYHLAFAGPNYSLINAEQLTDQGAADVAAQCYVDLMVSRRIALGSGHDVDLRFNVQNLLGREPSPIATLTGIPYSTYADPRGRYFQLTAAAHF